MTNERGMSGQEVKDVFGDREMLELEAIERDLMDTIDSIRTRLREEWDEDLQDELRNTIAELRNAQKRLHALDQKFSGINKEARPVM